MPASELSRGQIFSPSIIPMRRKWQARLKENNIVVDVRDTRLRVGFGLYHNADDVTRLLHRLREV